MESYTVNIRGRKLGNLLQNKTRVPVDGPSLTVENRLGQKSVSFVHGAWSQCGALFAAGDSLGDVYVFHLQKNRFSLVCSLRMCCTCLLFTNDCFQDLLVSLSDCSIVSLSTGSKIQVNSFNHHTSCVTNISFGESVSTVLSSSKDQAILWDWNTFKIIRILNLKRDADIVSAFFLSLRQIIVTAFNDSSVFLWSSITFDCQQQFNSCSGGEYLSIRTINASNDEMYLACAGKAKWLFVWDVKNNKKLCTFSLPEKSSSVKQVNFVTDPSVLAGNYLLAVLTSESNILIYNISKMELLHKITSTTGKITSFGAIFVHYQLLIFTLQGILEVFDYEDFVIPITSKVIVKNVHISKSISNKKQNQKKPNIKIKEQPANVKKSHLISIVKKYGQYPIKHRFFIWSQLLEFPQNNDAYKVLYQESLKVKPIENDYSFLNPGLKRTFLALISMLYCWHPMLREMDYFQCMLFPFVKVLHKSPIMCFELLVSLISNWCQYWFLFPPFEPFNILCVIENILLYHDRELMMHFLKHKITSKVFAWSILKTSFSEVFNTEEWLKLWDNIFSNPISFQLFAVVAFNITMRNVLLQCSTVDEFKKCYKMHGISATLLIEKAYILLLTTPNEIDPQPLVGEFGAIPKGIYPSLLQLSQFKVDIETLQIQHALDKEIDYIKKRESMLEVKSNYFKELQNLQMLRRNLLLEGLKLKETKEMKYLNDKLTRVQNIIQDNLSDQVSMLRATVGEDMFSNENEGSKKKYFEYQDFVRKLIKKNQ